MTEFLMLTFVAGLMIMSPGPDFAIVVKNSLLHGRRAGISASAGIALGNLVHVSINLLGVGLLIANSTILFSTVKVLGAAYLLYLGIKGLMTKSTVSQNTLKKEPQKINSFYSGFLTCLLNPKACLFYLSFFSVVLSADTQVKTQILYGVWITSLAAAWFVLVALFFASPSISKKIQQCKHWLERITGGVLVALGIKLLGAEASY